MVPILLTNGDGVESVESIKLLGLLLDQNLSWEEHIRYTKIKVAKSIGLLYRTRPFLGKQFLSTPYYLFIHTHLNYAHLSRASTIRGHQKNLLSQQKHAIQIVNSKTYFENTERLFNLHKILNIC